MKRILAVILAALLVFPLCACVPIPASSTSETSFESPDISESSLGVSVDMAALWNELGGVWGYAGEAHYFLNFTVEDGKYSISSGIFNSGYGIGGTVNAVTQTGDGAYSMTLDIPARPDSDEGSGWDAHSVELTLEYAGGKELKMTNFAEGDAICVFTYMGATFSDAASAVEVEQTDVAKEALDKLRGVWVYNDNGSLWFAYFNDEAGEFSYMTGLLFSDSGLGGTVKEVYRDIEGNGYRMILAFSGSSAGGADSGGDPVAEILCVGCTDIDSKKIVINNIADDGSDVTFRYAAPDLDSVDYDTVIGF